MFYTDYRSVSKVMYALIAVLLLNACGGKQEARDYKFDEAFTPYVSAYTTEKISRQSTIKVRLAQDVVAKDKVGFAMADSPLEFTPSIKGKARWIDRRTIEFEPSDILPSSQFYKASFKIGDFIPALKEEMKVFNFGFETRKQTFEVSVQGLETTDNAKLIWQALNGTLTTADFEHSELVEKLMEAKQDGKSLDIQWAHSIDGREHGFRIEKVKRQEDPSAVELTWNGAPIDVEIDGNQGVPVPALGDFHVLTASAFNNPEQYAVVKFSDPLKKGQNLDGLIRLEGKGLRFVIDGNEVKVYPRSRVTGAHKLKVEPGIRNVLGHKMQDSKEFEIQFEEIKPQVRLVGNGVILPRSGNALPFAFEAASLKSVQLRIKRIYEDNILQFLQVNDLDGSSEIRRVGKEVHFEEVRLDRDKSINLRAWNRHVLDLSKLINAEPGAIYRVELDFGLKNSVYSCDNGDEAEATSESSDDGPEFDDYEEEASYWDNYEDDDDYTSRWENRDNPCHDAYYTYYERGVSRNVLASDLGIISKRGTDGSMVFAVNNLQNTDPMSGVTIELYDFQQQLIASTSTDGDGTAMLKVEDQPHVMIAKQGAQRGYMRLGDGYSLSLSKFDVSGQRYYQGVKGFVYGERGVWRPGDSIFTTVVLEDKLNSLPEAHPVTFTLYNPMGQQVKKATRRNHVNGMYTFHTRTGSSAPTGNYRLNVSVGGASFDKTLKVETVTPNRLKIKIDFGKDYLSKEMESVEGDLSARWLHGAIAGGLKADVGVTLRPAKTSFKRFSDFIFDDPVRSFDSDPQNVFEGELDEQGESKVPLRISMDDEAPGMLRANFVTKVFEPGGNFSSDRFSIPYYPYEKFVGIKVPKGDKARGMLLTDKDHPVEIVTVNAEGKASGNSEVEMTIYKLDWKWWWDQNAYNVTNYNEKFYREKLSEEKVKVKNGSATWKFNIKYPSWGRYLVRACDEGGHCTGKIIYVDWPGWAGRAQKDNPGGAAMLTFAADKDKYEVGDNVTLTIPTGKTGRALVSLESGSRVLETHWVEANESGSAKFSFVATKEMTPNIYANVSLIQPHAQTKNDLPMRLYGVIPLEITDPNTVLKPQIKMAETLRPMEKVTVGVSEASGKPMTYTVAVVDEGLLDLTRFKTPDPWKTFYAREALDVKTWDLYDKVAGAYGAELTKLLGIGGGDGIGPKGGSKQNRFRPVVKFMGPFHLEAGQSASHSFSMPNYVGSVRTMVVAREGAAYGQTEKATPVRKPLMVLGTLPRVLGPGEDVRLPVTVFAMEDHVKNVSLKLESSDIFDVSGGTSRSMQFSKPGDDLAFFDLKVKKRIGTGTVKVTATSGSEKAIYHIDIDVRNPNPRVVNVEATAMDGGQSWAKDFRYPGMQGTNKGVLEVSSIPPINLGARLRYLLKYPHGCVEQTTSSVFPQLFVYNLMDMSDEMKKNVDRNIRAGIERLQKFQQPSGGLSYWPGSGEVNEWGTNYAGNFVIEAKKKGYRVSDRFLTKWVKYQKGAAKNWSHSGRASELTQADRLYLLARAGAPELGAMNRLRERPNLDNVAKWRLAAAYHLAGQTDMSKRLTKDLSLSVKEYTELGWTYGNDLRDRAIILECIGTIGNRLRGADLSQDISKSLSDPSKWLSTQTTGYCLIAMAKYAGHSDGSAGKLTYSYKVNGGSWKDITTDKPVSQIDLEAGADTEGKVEVKNKTGGMMFARLVLDGIPETGDQDGRQSKIRMEITYMDMDGSELDPTIMQQGTDFVAEVKITNPGDKGELDELALNQIFPSGWEIHNTRMDGTGFNSSIAVPEYQDIRDDRVYTYFDLGAPGSKRHYSPWSYPRKAKNEPSTKTFRILLNASYLGKFYLPTVYVEAMYDKSVSARIPGRWVQVVAPSDS